MHMSAYFFQIHIVLIYVYYFGYYKSRVRDKVGYLSDFDEIVINIVLNIISLPFSSILIKLDSYILYKWYIISTHCAL